VTFWGVTDKFSWLNDWPIKGRTNYPLLFDRNYKEKKAYQRIMNLNMTIN
jgi:endo-1,4-beta-xylanase